MNEMPSDSRGQEEPEFNTTVNGWLKRPEVQKTWDIEQLMAKGTTLIISGNTGIGKSWETKHLAFRFYSGQKWHGLQCRKLTPIYITTELTENQMRRRLKKLAPQYPDAKGIHFIANKHENYRLNTSTGRNNLFGLLNSKCVDGKFGVVILDPLAMFIDSEIQKVDWNKQVEPVLTELKRCYDCSLVLNHNFRKAVRIYGHEEDLF
ncbi:AAA family ATPase [Chloroflexota bacterium]